MELITAISLAVYAHQIGNATRCKPITVWLGHEDKEKVTDLKVSPLNFEQIVNLIFFGAPHNVR
ncbi:hypothetical protein BUE64_03075 [Corynebacterium diphtheriae subsp. lausannense]|nr:hypothetical protein BUE64_03075 [Corynebacterium diphtheriae subsp. lausannense]OWM36210.1 hypothetical protein AZF07_01360 [Corynebacterium diphtheriae subsp. lausannense]